MLKMKNLWSLLSIILVTMHSFTFISCSDDKENETPKANPLVGNWLYVSEEDMVCYLLTFTDKETFDYQSQKVETKNSFGGTFTYNETTKKLILTPTRTSELPIEYQLKSVDEQSLIVSDETGKILIFSRILDSHFPVFDWKEKTPDQLLIGMWEANDNEGRTLTLSFREDNVFTGKYYGNTHKSRQTRGDEYVEKTFMGEYKLDAQAMKLTTHEKYSVFNDVITNWRWTDGSRTIRVSETSLELDGYTFTRINDSPIDLCEDAMILGTWKQTTQNGYILFTFKADYTVIRHELNGSTWLSYEELDYTIDVGKNLKIGNEMWYEQKTDTTSLNGSNGILNYYHSWFGNSFSLVKTDEKDMLLGGKSNLYERVNLLTDKKWTYTEKEDNIVYKEIIVFTYYGLAEIDFYENDNYTESKTADYYYDYRNNIIYLKPWYSSEQDSDLIEVVSISENILRIKDEDIVLTFYNR